jgi:hypothetical protein
LGEARDKRRGASFSPDIKRPLGLFVVVAFYLLFCRNLKHTGVVNRQMENVISAKADIHNAPSQNAREIAFLTSVFAGLL